MNVIHSKINFTKLSISIPYINKLYLFSECSLCVPQTGNVIHNLQRERDWTAIFLSSIGAETTIFLRDRYADTDEALAELNSWPTDSVRSQTATGQILGLRAANKRRRYKATPSLIGWEQT